MKKLNIKLNIKCNFFEKKYKIFELEKCAIDNRTYGCCLMIKVS